MAKSKNSSYPAAHEAGYCKRALRDFEAASYYFQEAARIAPDRFEPLLEIANIQYRLREYKKALISIDAALAHTKETEKIKLLRIRMLNGLGEYGQIITIFANDVETSELTRQQRYAWKLRLIRAHFMMGNLDTAAELAQIVKVADQSEYSRWSGRDALREGR